MTAHEHLALYTLVGRIVRLRRSVKDIDFFHGEKDMIAFIATIDIDQDDVCSAVLHFHRFESYNATKRVDTNYYDDDKKPVLNSVEAGVWRPIQRLYCDMPSALSYFDVVSTTDIPVHSWKNPRENLSFISILPSLQEHQRSFLDQDTFVPQAIENLLKQEKNNPDLAFFVKDSI